MVAVGYSIYGDGVASPIYETAALKGAPAVKVIIGFLSAHLVMAYPIVLNPPERALETALGVEQSRCGSRMARTAAQLNIQGLRKPHFNDFCARKAARTGAQAKVQRLLLELVPHPRGSRARANMA